MKTLLVTAAAALLSTAALAQEAPLNEGMYSASTARQFDANSEDMGRFDMGDVDLNPFDGNFLDMSFSSSRSARANEDERTGQSNYGSTVDTWDIYSGR